LVLPVPRLGVRHLGPRAWGPAPVNLPIPEYTFVSDTKLRIGEGGTASA
jgi:Rieske Fe-S protein